MKRLLLFLIGVATPSSAREWVLGDTLEEFEHIESADGPAAARRWLRAEVWRVLVHAPRYRVVVRRPPSLQPRIKGGGSSRAVSWRGPGSSTPLHARSVASIRSCR